MHRGRARCLVSALRPGHDDHHRTDFKAVTNEDPVAAVRACPRGGRRQPVSLPWLRWTVADVRTHQTDRP